MTALVRRITEIEIRRQRAPAASRIPGRDTPVADTPSRLAQLASRRDTNPGRQLRIWFRETVETKRSKMDVDVM